MRSPEDPIRGRGAAENPQSRFDRRVFEAEPTEAPWDEAPEPGPPTQVLRDPARRVIATNHSPDVGFDASLNPYRGCEHGCIYCYARPTHEYLGFSAGLDFETKILAKRDAAQQLRSELTSGRWQPRVLALSGVTDAYQPVERKLRITRACLEVLVEFCNPVAIVTKSALVTRDIDLLTELSKHDAASVMISVTTLDPALHRILEPRSTGPAHRLAAIRTLSEAGIPVGVLVAPIIPAVTDHELPRILEAAAEAGARFAGRVLLRLPHGVAPLFEAWLGRHMPDRRDKVLNRIRALRGGKLSDPRFGSRMRGEGVFAEQIEALFRLAARRAGLDRPGPTLSTTAFRRPSGPQLALF